MKIPDLSLPNPVKLGSGHQERTLAGALVVLQTDAQFQRLDPDGSHRNVTLPPEQPNAGLWYHILNLAGGAENLVILDDGASTVATISQNEAAVVVCDGTTWEHMGIVTIALS